MKVGLIHPSSGEEVTKSMSMVKEHGLYPSLGLGYIAAVLEKNEYDVDYIDIDATGLDEEGLRNQILKQKYEVIGITCTSFTVHHAKNIAKIVKNVNPNIFVVVGGPQLFAYPVETVQFVFFDAGIQGDGEYSMLELVKKLERKEDITGIEGLVWKDENGEVHVNPLPPLIKDLDKIPFPARHLMPNDKFYCPIAKHRKFTTMIATRGCPYKCTFCMRPKFMNKFRARNAKNVVDEIEFVGKEFGIKEILFYDDTFTLNQKRVMEICREINLRGLNIGWDCRTRVDCVSRELLFEMKKAGCTRIHYGVESGDQKILDEVLRKGYTLDQVRSAFKWTKEAGIEILAYFMIGSPGETMETIQKTFDFIYELDPDYVMIGITNIHPKTDMFSSALENGQLKNDVWREYTLGNLEEPPLPLFESEEYSKEDLQRMIIECYRRHYLRMNYILRRLKKTKSPGEFIRYTAGMFSLIFKSFNLSNILTYK